MKEESSNTDKSRNIILYPDPILSEECDLVLQEQFNENLTKIMDDLKYTMQQYGGVGLAAPQIGEMIRAFVIKTSGGILEFINPVITEGEGKQISNEGCLSIPNYFEVISRYNKIVISYQDRDGKYQVRHLEGLDAIKAQHENDHLDGILFIDRFSRIKKTMFNKWFSKKKKMAQKMIFAEKHRLKQIAKMNKDKEVGSVELVEQV